MYISFDNPVYLFLFLVIPVIIFIHFLTLRGKRKKALKFANFDAIARARGVDLLSKNIVLLVISIVIVFLLVLAFAGLTLHMKKRASSFSFVLAIDSSRSMSADDIAPTRFDAAKSVAKEFIDDAPSFTQIGIISFSGNSIIEKEVTGDKNALKSSINFLEISEMEGTDIFEAVITSTNLLGDEESRAIIILSDGQLNVGTIDEAVDYANKNDVVVNTIAFGTEEGGRTSYGISKVDKDALEALAYHTEGNFYSAESRDALRESFDEILSVDTKKVSIDLRGYLMLAVFILFLALYVLMNTRYRTIP